MDANVRTAHDLFDITVCYEIPAFQRPYVWTEEDQWQPLWDDITRVVDALIELEANNNVNTSELPSHFLGAVVLKQLPSVASDPSRTSVIDGQQRLTTLQMLLHAAHVVCQQFGREEDAESIQELVSNSAKRFFGTHKRFKLWPSRKDRMAFEHVMDDNLSVHIALPDSRIAQEHTFFRDAITTWAKPIGDPDKVADRLSALSRVLQYRLQIVAIDLSSNDDDQLIFEALNDRGTPLLAADLIKNYIFQRCENLGADVDEWSKIYWEDFDDDWWRQQIAQGRLYRSRIDLFLQYWLTMRIRDEIPTDAVFARFRNYASDHLIDQLLAEKFLKGLRADADTFRDFTQLDPKSARGSFYFGVVEALELGAFIPLLLWLIRDNHTAPVVQVDKAFAALESWAVRRTLLRQTMKDVNKFVVAILKELDQHPADILGDVIVDFLGQQTADSRFWPNDNQLRDQLPTIRAYGNIKQQRLRFILSTIEFHLRTKRNEDVSLPTKLEIEHILPRGWRTYWDNGAGQIPQEAARLDHLVDTIGNLTLVTQKLNGALSNRPWIDSDFQKISPTGKEKGLGKRSLLGNFSILLLNKEIVDNHPDVWSENQILNRSKRLTEDIISIWPWVAELVL